MKKEFTDRNKFVFKAMQHYYKSVHIQPLGNNEYGFCRWIFASEISQLTALSELIIKTCMLTLERSGKVKRRFVGSGVQQFSLAKFDGFKATNEYFEFNDFNNDPKIIQVPWGWIANPNPKAKATDQKLSMPLRERNEVQELLYG